MSPQTPNFTLNDSICENIWSLRSTERAKLNFTLFKKTSTEHLTFMTRYPMILSQANPLCRKHTLRKVNFFSSPLKKVNNFRKVLNRKSRETFQRPLGKKLSILQIQ